MNMKLTSTTLAALMIAGSTSFSAFAAMPNGTVVIGTKAYDMDYANDPAHATEITASIVAGGTVYYKDFNGKWLDNVTGAAINASVIPAVTYTNSTGTTNYNLGDADANTAATSATVSAIAADQLKVTFNGAVKDASKVKFDVASAAGAAVTTTVSWNTAMTEATLTKAAKFSAGDYKVAVTNDTVAYGTSTVTIAEQKIAKIDITSSKLGVVNKTVGSTTTQTGYATYKVLDQYGVDITKLALANNVQFQTGVGSIEFKNGLITLTPSTGLNLLTFGTGIVITANDTTTGVSTSATLVATSQIGTLSDINLQDLTNKDGKVLTAGDTSDVFYANYTATDISGNPTTNYTLMKEGLILSTAAGHTDELTTSSPYVVAKLVQDPTDSTKGLIQVTATTDSITVDQPLVITAMTWTGKTSQISTTLKKQAEVKTFTLLAPSDSIASGESKIIPFTAVDQNGVAITKYSDLFGYVTLTNAHFIKNLDGTASVKNEPITNTGTNSIQDVISASTKMGGFNSITINIQKVVVADTLSLDTSVLKTTLALGGATEKADFGWDMGGFVVKDQFGRVIDMTTAIASDYEILATSSDTSVVTADSKLSTGDDYMNITSGNKAGSATVTFNLVKKNAETVILDSKSQTFSVVANDDIKDYAIDASPSALYAVNDLNTSVTAQDAGYKFNPTVYGTTSTGGKVVLAGTPIRGASLTSDDFTLVPGTTSGKSDVIEVVANKFADSAKTGSSATLAVTVMGVDGNVYTVTTPVTSSTVKPAAVSMTVHAATEITGIAQDTDTDIITLTETGSATYSSLLGNSLAKFVKSTGEKTTGNVYFKPIDQYGNSAQSLSLFTVVPSGTNLHGHNFAISNDGDVTGNAQTGDYVTVAGSTTSGLVKTTKIVFGSENTAVTVDPQVALLETATTAVATAQTSKLAADKTKAQTAVDKLTAGTAKDALQTKVTAIVTSEDSAAAVKLDAATTAVATAVKAQSQVKKDAAQALVTALPTSAAKDALQVKVTAIVVLSDAKLVENTTTEFATNLAANDNTLLGGTVDNTAAKTITVTDTSATTGTGVFDTLAKLNVTSVTLGTTKIELTDTVAAKAAVLKYFSNNLIAGTTVDLAVTGTNGISIVASYTMVNAIK